MGTEFSYFFLQNGLKLQLNKQLQNYLEMYKKSYPDLNSCCTTQDPMLALDMSEKIHGVSVIKRSL
jgi:hypothetical protein